VRRLWCTGIGGLRNDVNPVQKIAKLSSGKWFEVSFLEFSFLSSFR
jgi:hypothetical protein